MTVDPRERQLLAQLLGVAVARLDVDRALEEKRFVETVEFVRDGFGSALRRCDLIAEAVFRAFQICSTDSLRNRVSSSAPPYKPALAFRPLGPRLPDPATERGCGQVQLAGDGHDGLPLVEDEAHRPVLNSSENRRRARRHPLPDRMRDIVSTFRNVSTETDQAHTILIDPRPGIANRPDSSARKGSNLYVTVRLSGQVARIKTQTGGVEYIDVAPPATTGYAVHGIALRP